MLPTPDTSHIDPSLLYDPAEDSFLLLDTLSSPSETSFLTSRFNRQTLSSSPTNFQPPANHESPAPPLIVEVGTGSGVVLAFATAQAQPIFGREDIVSLGVDINPHACQASQTTVRKALSQRHPDVLQPHGNPQSTPTSNAVFLGTIQSSLLSSFRPGTIDVLIFNPPYVPTPALGGSHGQLQDLKVCLEDGAGADGLLELSWAGGTDGMQVTHRFLEQVPLVLSARGVVYLLLCARNQPDEVVGDIQAWEGGWRAEIVGRSGGMGGWERLVVLRIWRGV